ncbi:MAG TPA: 1-(5-phosphoribosyl)-5-[(5-phosphoribosylamino)methylideneamino] imidazole-4-carboxamide isomerase [Bryobacteraceae bacterium]|nr:1-(5-phosphoribosyl)-5-[(5-phosphoribosylamino)methylideneamino] imidazole-4-carboxamide isomerase [Bryobacteraceae bacterium]
MVIPCIDLQGRKVVQLVQGREKALEGGSPQEMIDKFRAFPMIQVIDLDAAMGTGSNEDLVEWIAVRARVRVGGGVRTPAKARRLVDLGVDKVIVGTAAFSADGPNYDFLRELTEEIDASQILLALDSKDGRIVVKGWRESTNYTAAEVIQQLEPFCAGFLCTYVDKEGMMQGTDLEWFRSLRSATSHEITAAGGITTIEDVQALQAMNIHSALGMAIYTGRLDLKDLEPFASL